MEAVAEAGDRSKRRRPGSPLTGEQLAAKAARCGLAARTVFYLLLVYLVAQLIADGGGGKQANANGALTTIGSRSAGRVALVATAVGFVAFGLIRTWGAVRDSDPSTWRRATTFLQGVFYLALAWLPLSYTFGRRSVGSEQQQHQTASGLLHLPGGRGLTVAVGVIVLVVCANQIWTGLRQDYADGMELAGAPRWVEAVVRAAGTLGIPVRAAVFLPVGIFFIIAGIRGNAGDADGLDRELSALAGSWWGDALLVVIALGLLVFAIYSGLETRYRALARGE